MYLSIFQKEVIMYDGHSVVLACPGSGKTTVIAYKVEQSLRADPYARILFTSFTKTSANDIRKRIIDLVGTPFSNRIATGTFHAIALDQLRKAGFTGKIIKGNQFKQYIKRALEISQLENINPDLAVEFIEKCRSNLQYLPTNDDWGHLYKNYVKLLDESKSLDFSGILSKAINLMRDRKLSPKSCGFLLCDEAQDMDQTQYEWCVEHIKAGSKIIIVGDDDQSIYKFRGALGFEGMMRFTTEFGAKIF
jgi:superfamily I DNA/RNA helicase